MNENFDRAFAFAMDFEGYRSDDPVDPGGRTIFGISARSHPEVVSRLWDLPKDEALIFAKEFYRIEYWDELGCGSRSFPDDVVMFDTGVNLGITRTMGLRSISKNPFDFLMKRINHYLNISDGPKIKFLRGWLRRALQLYGRMQ